ncbi:DDE-type integrase/transposase/recombinase [Streptomyces sp. NBC_00986]|uniref:DDE-type integrase/transposase/recombinase n=1 Tax=Streptomyces sp. NBC_00986 TaxID=2903702 RepID=UPI00386EEC3A|nr:DDE-type integrase/transposase/recombinase [Streptomyces sp. NBC_00986]
MHLRLAEGVHRAGPARLASVGELSRQGHGRTQASRTEDPAAPVADQAGQAADGPGLRAPGLHRRGARLVWCGDLTEIDTDEGKLCLATVIDLFSRRLLGYAMGERDDAELVVASLNMAAEATYGA